MDRRQAVKTFCFRLQKLCGKEITSVYISKDFQRVGFVLKGGKRIVLGNVKDERHMREVESIELTNWENVVAAQYLDVSGAIVNGYYYAGSVIVLHTQRGDIHIQYT